MDINTIVLLCLAGAILLMLVIALAIANFAGENLLTIYNEYSKKIVDFNTPLKFAKEVSQNEFNGRIATEIIPGLLTDHFRPWKISLSSQVANSSNVSAFAVCAHELGHAIQHRDTPQKMKKYSQKVIFSRVVSKLTLPLVLIAVPFAFFNIITAIVIFAGGILCFLSGLFTKLSTIRIESEASQNALLLLQKYAYFDDEDVKCAKKVLSAAKLTYIASFLKSVLKWTFLVNRYDFY